MFFCPQLDLNDDTGVQPAITPLSDGTTAFPVMRDDYPDISAFFGDRLTFLFRKGDLPTSSCLQERKHSILDKNTSSDRFRNNCLKRKGHYHGNVPIGKDIANTLRLLGIVKMSCASQNFKMSTCRRKACYWQQSCGVSDVQYWASKSSKWSNDTWKRRVRIRLLIYWQSWDEKGNKLDHLLLKHPVISLYRWVAAGK